MTVRQVYEKNKNRITDVEFFTPLSWGNMYHQYLGFTVAKGYFNPVAEGLYDADECLNFNIEGTTLNIFIDSLTAYNHVPD